MSTTNKDIPVIQKTHVTPMLVKAFCDVCGTELLRDDNNTLLSYPPKYLHKCPKCGKEFMLTQYPGPKIEFEPNYECAEGDG